MSALNTHLITPQWPAPDNVRAVITTRAEGMSAATFASNNLALHVGDNEQAVIANRQQLQRQLGVDHIQWLEQIHGQKIAIAQSDSQTRTADGSITATSGLACAVMTADCLPILLCDKQGTQVAALHAGWRGLSEGIVHKGVNSFANPDQLLAYLGPAIGPRHFEVGIEVLEAFFALAATPAAADAIAAAFKPAPRAMHFYADLYALARLALHQAGVDDVYGGDFCTYSQADQFYSYRRDANCGRMASLIWLD